LTGAREERLGLLFAALCAGLGAFGPAFGKLTTNAVDAGFTAAVTGVFAAVAAMAVLVARGELRELARADRLPRLVVVAALGTAAAFALFYEGAKRASAIDAVLCLQIEPAYSLVLSWLALGHRPTLRRVLAVVALLCGIAVAVGARELTGSVGVWLLLATPLAWQLSHLVVLRGLVGTPPAVLTGARYVFGSVLLAAWWLVSSGAGSAPGGAALASLLPLLAIQGVVLSFGGTMLWYQTIARLDLGRATAIVVPSIPLLSLGASFALLGEVATWRQWLGLALTLSGVVAFVTAPHAAPRPAASREAGSFVNRVNFPEQAP
jgi:drug/metabolite transporter (DMT)-like permease